MDFGYIFSDAFKYPLSDYKKLLMLAIPNLILQVISLIITSNSIFSSDNLHKYANSTVSPNALMPVGLLLLALLLLILIVGIFNRGISIETIKKSFTSNELPDFDIQRFFVSGLKYIIVLIGYVIIPTVILLIMAFLGFGIMAAFADSEIAVIGLIIAMFIIVFVLVASIVISILTFVAYGRLAETNSLSEAYDFKNIYNMAKQIGMLDIFAVEILSIIIFAILTLIFSLVSIIPIIGPLIYGVTLTYMSLVSARIISLVYCQRTVPQGINYTNQPDVPNYQSRYVNDSVNENQAGYNQSPGGYDMLNQGNYQPHGYNQPGTEYNQNDIVDNSQEFNQNNQTQKHDNNQNYYNPSDAQKDNNIQEYQEDDSIIKDKSDDLDFKNIDSKDDNKPEN